MPSSFDSDRPVRRDQDLAAALPTLGVGQCGLDLLDAVHLLHGRCRQGTRQDPMAEVGVDRPHLLGGARSQRAQDRKSTRLNSSHLVISYAVFCLKKKKKKKHNVYRCM